EDEVVLAAHRQILQRHPDALLILVTRHPERFDTVARQIEAAGLTMVRRSAGSMPAATDQVLLGDTMGELMQFYACGDVAFVGGSLIAGGGDKYVEPAALGLPGVSGPHRCSFTECGLLPEQARGRVEVG